MNANYIVETENGFVVVNGNAQSEQTYSSESDALVASNEDSAAYIEHETASEAEDHSPINWV